MIGDKYREQFSIVVARSFRNLYSDVYEKVGDAEVFSSNTIYSWLEKPKDPKMGRFALPVFRSARLLKEKPPEIAEKIAEEANKVLSERDETRLVHAEAAGGFINARVDFEHLAEESIKSILDAGESFGDTDAGKGKTVLIEYSSPNIAKPFGIGHLRTTIIGNSLRQIFKKLGYEVVGINYPGDWGTQFGKMIVAWRKWGEEDKLDEEGVMHLLDLYVKYHKEAEEDESLDDEAREAFRKLEKGDEDNTKLWKRFKEISFEEFNRVYDLLGVEFDLVIGESFFNDKMAAVIDRLEKAGLTHISKGALIVELEDANLPPALLQKADGATLYITRDLAGMIWRWQEYKFYESIYIVGSAQADHFKQCMQVIEKLEEAEETPSDERMTGRIKHIEFGWVKFGGTSMSTREGNIIYLEDVIKESVQRVTDIIEEKNPDLENSKDIAHQVGVGAVLFSQMSVRRLKDVHFVWEDVLNFDGETGPYLQYTHARLCSLLRNHEGEISADVDISLLEHEEETRVIEQLADFPTALRDAREQYEPYFIVAYLIRLAAAFNKVYQRKKDDGAIDKIISDDAKLTAARIALVKCVQTVLKEGLGLLGMKAPERM